MPPLSFNWTEGVQAVKAKDVSMQVVEKHFPKYLELAKTLAALLPAKKYLSVTISAKDYRVGESTCLDTGWHTDGLMNQDDPEHYAIVCFGPDGSRTMFCVEPLTGYINETPSNIQERIQFFGNLMQRDLNNEAGGLEVPHGCPITYTTFDVHKGRKVCIAGKRVFIRVMASNHIKPKPFER